MHYLSSSFLRNSVIYASSFHHYILITKAVSHLQCIWTASLLYIRLTYLPKFLTLHEQIFNYLRHYIYVFSHISEMDKYMLGFFSCFYFFCFFGGVGCNNSKDILLFSQQNITRIHCQ